MNYSKLIIISVCAAALSSCGGQGPLTGPGGQASAAQMAQALTQINSSLGAFGVKNEPTLPKVGGAAGQTVSTSSVGLLAANAFDDCTQETPNPTVDADLDSISKLLVISYNCNNVNNSGTDVTLKGTVKIVDKDDTVKWMAGGYHVDYDTTWSAKGSAGMSWDWSGKGYFDMGLVGGAYVYDSDYRSSGTGNEHGKPYEITYQGTWKHKITPDAGAVNVWNSGLIEFEGFFQMAGTFGSGLDTFGVTFEMSSSNLIYDYNACTTYKSGTISIGDGAGNKTILTYACTGLTATFNGTAITLDELRLAGERKTRLGSLF